MSVTQTEQRSMIKHHVLVAVLSVWSACFGVAMAVLQFENEEWARLTWAVIIIMVILSFTVSRLSQGALFRLTVYTFIFELSLLPGLFIPSWFDILATSAEGGTVRTVGFIGGIFGIASLMFVLIIFVNNLKKMIE